jgi:hypothetical protein
MEILFDTGCGGTLISHKLVKGLRTKATSGTTWTTKSGTFETNQKCKVTFTLPAFHENRDINWNCYVDSSKGLSRYDMIIGRDLLEELGMDFIFSEGLMKWDNATVLMKDTEWLDSQFIEVFTNEVLSMHDPDTTDAAHIQDIIESKYTPADLPKIVEECSILTKDD